MVAQIKVMLDQIAQLTRAMANKENVPNGSGGSGSGGGGGGGGSGGGRRGHGERYVAVQYNKPQSMGCYCSSHRFHPAGVNHTSTTCQWKGPNHNIEAMWTNRKGGSVHWPPPI